MDEQNGATMDDFARRLAARNPFLDNRINGPSADDVDVEAIHRKAFERLTKLALEACEHRRGVGVMLWGEAGIGKSHLLSRFARWAKEDDRAYLIYLHNLQAAPEHLPRSLLHFVITRLTHGRSHQFGSTPLFDLVHAALLEALNHRLGRYSWTQVKHAFDGVVERLACRDLPGETPLDGTVWNVLYQFYRSTYRALQKKEDGLTASLAVRWLAGQTLDAEEAKTLGLPLPPQSEETVSLQDNEQIKQVLVALTRLAASRNRPFLLVFDQVDNLDREQTGALARFLEALIDSSPNLLVVTAGIQSTLLQWREAKVIQDSAWDRLAQEEITLLRLQVPEAIEIVSARLRIFLKPYASIEGVNNRGTEDALFPIGEKWFKQALGDRAEIRPRDAINKASRGWRYQQATLTSFGPLEWLRTWPDVGLPETNGRVNPKPEEMHTVIDNKINEKWAEIVERSQHEPHTFPHDADHLAGLVYSALVQCRDAEHRYGVWEVDRVPPPRTGKPTYHLSLRVREAAGGGDVRTGILFLAERSAISVAAYLKRLLEHWGDYHRVVVATVKAIGLPLGKAGEENLKALRERGEEYFRIIELLPMEIVELQAMQQVAGLAHAGDLEIEWPVGVARAVSLPETIEAYHRQGRYRASRLLQALFSPSPRRESARLL